MWWACLRRHARAGICRRTTSAGWCRRVQRSALSLAGGCACGFLVAAAVTADDGLPVHGFRVVASWPHDPTAFTQGLVWANGALYESTGGHGHSSLRRVDLASGRVVQQRLLSDSLFGEGLTAWRGTLVQLTWRAGRVLRYDQATFAALDELSLAGEGWGLTHDGERWIISDGSSTLRFLDPATGAETRRVQVLAEGRPLRRLNELEWVPVPVADAHSGADATTATGATSGRLRKRRDEIWANIWHDDRLARIDPADGEVLGYVDLTGLWPQRKRPHPEAVLNGIAFDAARRRLLVTGKHWPRLYWIAVPGLLPAGSVGGPD